MVHLYALDIRALPDPETHPEVLKRVSEERRMKTMKCRMPDDRKRSLGAGILLEEILPHFGVSPLEIRKDRNGKPAAEGIFFNLSHSGDMVICAVSEKKVGCDVERIANASERIAERFFHPNEFAYLKACREEERNKSFYRLWTMKESYIKMTGEGMRLPFESFELLLEPEETRVRRDGEILSCRMREYEIPGYRISVCAEEGEFAEEIAFVEGLLCREGSYS